MSLRFYLRIGSDETLRFTFDVSKTPQNTLTGLLIKFYVKRTKTQTFFDIEKSSVDPLQINVVDATAGIIDVFIKSVDTVGLVAGDYYFWFELSHEILEASFLTPDAPLEGDLIFVK